MLYLRSSLLFFDIVTPMSPLDMLFKTFKLLPLGVGFVAIKEVRPNTVKNPAIFIPPLRITHSK